MINLLMEDNILFLKNLNKKINSNDGKSIQLTKDEFTKLDDILKNNYFVITIVSIKIFGGYGIKIYEHELYPGTGPQFLAMITEDNLPCPIYEKKTQGSGSDFAWEYFSKYANNKKNIDWCKMYKLSIPRERSYYDY